MSGEEKLLFGTAFSVVLPANIKDVSGIRDIPDNQEVFCHPETDQSFIIELMEYVQDNSDQEALKTHFMDLAEANDASEDCQIILTEEIPLEHLTIRESSSAWYLAGEQQISKFHESAKNTVRIHMGLIRLLEHSTDILITLNDPVLISAASSSQMPIPTSAVPWQVEDFRAAITSLQLLDTGIFND